MSVSVLVLIATPACVGPNAPAANGDSKGTVDSDVGDSDSTRDSEVDTGPVERRAPFVSVDLAPHRSCGLRADGTAECWGAPLDTEYAPPFEGVVAVTSGRDGVCSVGYSLEASCGDASFDGPVRIALAEGPRCVLRADGGVVCVAEDSDDYGVGSAPATSLVQLDMSRTVACGVESSGAAYCWGADGDDWVPAGDYVQVDVGDSAHACGLRRSGVMECWGNPKSPLADESGQLPTMAGPFKTIATSYAAACGLDLEGQLSCVGDGIAGEHLPPEGRFVDFDLTDCHGCAVTELGEVQCWGWDPSYGSHDCSWEYDPHLPPA